MDSHRNLKKGDSVEFVVKEHHCLVKMTGIIMRFLNSREAKDNGYITGRRTGQVLELIGPDEKIYFKYRSVCKLPKEKRVNDQ